MKRWLVLVILVACSGGPRVDEVVGASCIDGRDCADLCLRGGDFPGGFCSLSCRDDRDCPSDTICANVAGGVCLFPCDLRADCDFLGARYTCKERRDTFDRRVRVCIGD
jgi:hypothetical protein